MKHHSKNGSIECAITVLKREKTFFQNWKKVQVADHQRNIDMAKQICMIQRTPEGKQIRQYFIDLEKAWNTPEQIFARALKMADKTIESIKKDNAVLME